MRKTYKHAIGVIIKNIDDFTEYGRLHMQSFIDFGDETEYNVGRMYMDKITTLSDLLVDLGAITENKREKIINAAIDDIYRICD